MHELYVVTHPHAEHTKRDVVGGRHDSHLTPHGLRDTRLVAEELLRRRRDAAGSHHSVRSGGSRPRPHRRDAWFRAELCHYDVAAGPGRSSRFRVLCDEARRNHPPPAGRILAQPHPGGAGRYRPPGHRIAFRPRTGVGVSEAGDTHQGMGPLSCGHDRRLNPDSTFGLTRKG